MMKGGAYSRRRTPHRSTLLGARSVLTLGVLCLLALGVWLLPAPVGNATYVVTRGVSMEPRFHTGDLAVLHEAEEYRVGDVVAYRSDLMKTVVMHRIIEVGDGRYSFQGDNNPTPDPEALPRDHLIGTLAMRIPRGGTLLNALSAPTVLGVVAFALLASGGAATRRTRTRTRTRTGRTTLTRHRRGADGGRRLPASPPGVQGAAGVLIACGVLGLLLAGLSWTRPASTVQTVVREPAQSMTFSYRATVPRTAAYDGTTVGSPDPVFRKLARLVEVRYSYAGPPGSIVVAADLTTPSGWHSTLELRPRTAFTSRTHAGTVDLDLTEIQRRADEAAAVIGVPVAQVDIGLVAAVRSGGETFPAALRLSLTPQSLTLADGPESLVATDSTTARTSEAVPSTLDLAGRHLSVATARLLSLLLVGGAVLTAIILALLVRTIAPSDEAARIRRRLAPRLVGVQTPPEAPGDAVVDVVQVAMLARLADVYEVPVLHWSGAGVDTFLVRHDGTSYRYETTRG
jgi:signal peptidase I